MNQLELRNNVAANMSEAMETDTISNWRNSKSQMNRIRQIVLLPFIGFVFFTSFKSDDGKITEMKFKIGIDNAETEQYVGQNENPKRSVLFTLRENEEIYANEYIIAQYFNQNRFACIIYDDMANKLTFVFNGKRIISDSKYANFSLSNRNFSYLNLAEDNGYIFCYNRKDGYYVNCKGTINGPFRSVLLHPYDDFITSGINYDYYYRLDGKWYGKKGTQKPKLILQERKAENYCYADGADYVFDSHLTKNGKYACVCTHNNRDYKQYININGNISPEYDEITSLYLTESGQYAYAYENDRKRFVNINGNIYQGGLNVSLHLTENGEYAYSYSNNNNKYQVNINGDISQEYAYVDNLFLTESGKYAYRCSNQEILQRNRLPSYANWQVIINGNASQVYEGVGSLRLTESGKYAYTYTSNGKRYVNINDNVSQEYDGIGYLRLTESGKYAYIYQSNKKWHININDNISPGYDDVYELSLSDNGEYYYKYVADSDGIIYQNDNGKISKTQRLISNYDRLFDFTSKIELYSTNRESSFLSNREYKERNAFFSSYKYEYVSIDGKQFGKSPALHAWYDKDKNSFIWNAIEGRELVVYEYKLD